MHSKRFEKSLVIVIVTIPRFSFQSSQKTIINIRLNNFKDISNIVRIRISIIENFKNNNEGKSGILPSEQNILTVGRSEYHTRMNIYSRHVLKIR